MADTFSILMPTGLVMDVGVIAPVNGTGNYGASVVSPVMPGIRVNGTGEIPVERLSGRRGTMRVSFVTGTAGGSGQAVAAISVSGTSLFLGLMLDTSNKPVVIIRDRDGNPIAESAPQVGAAIAAGTPIEVVFAWDTTGVVYQGLFAGVVITSGTYSQVPEWTIAPTATWNSFIPDVLYVGLPPPGFSLDPFTGSIRVVQVSEVVEFEVPSSVSIPENLEDSALLAGDSTLTADATVVYAIAATMDGDSATTADATVAYAAESTMDGDSVVTADGDLVPP